MKNPQTIVTAVAVTVAAVSGAGMVLALDHSANARGAAPATTPVRSTANPDGGRATRVADQQESAKQIYAGAKDAVAYISASTDQGEATGTGFAVTADGLIVTNAHVVGGASQIQVQLGTAGSRQDAQLVGLAPKQDLAVLRIDAGGAKLPTLLLADSSKVGVGDATYAIGNPYGLDHTFTTGIVSALGRQIQAPDGSVIDGVIQTDAAINPGNSGGPLLNGSGQVIGVNSQIVSGSQAGGGGNVGIGFAIPSNTVAQVVAQAKSGRLQSGAGQDPQQQEQDPSQQQDQQLSLPDQLLQELQQLDVG